ncbi:MAG: glycerol-3-phosphate 1-O-acyltransferase PlsY [Thiohalomonadales bacterium]
MPDFNLIDAALVLLAYLFGSISTAIIVCRLMDLPDPRLQGSNNPGATNVLRFGGKKAAAITLFGDALKGVVPVAIALSLGIESWPLAIIAFAAFLGHLYPIFFQFRGGKGVATAFGVLATLSWPAGLSMLLTWIIIAKVFRVSSLAALLAAFLSPIYIWYWTGENALLILSIVISLLLTWRHRSNIKKLLSGSEGKIN